MGRINDPQVIGLLLGLPHLHYSTKAEKMACLESEILLQVLDDHHLNMRNLEREIMQKVAHAG